MASNCAKWGVQIQILKLQFRLGLGWWAFVALEVTLGALVNLEEGL